MADPIAATRLGTNLARISSIPALQGSESVTIGFNGSGEDYELPEDFILNATSSEAELDMVEVRVSSRATAGAGNVAVSRTAGVWTITNTSGASATGTLRVWIQYHHTAIR